MIIKKPYVLLIKHFRKIHVILFVLGLFVYYMHTRLGSFLNEFLEYGIYNSYNPISYYITWFSIIIILVLIFFSISLIFLLKKKNKPWKLYLIPAITYIIMILLYSMLISYFNTYNGVLVLSEVRLYIDLVVTLNLIQLPGLLIFIIRAIGLDLKKFDFQFDEEYLELDDSDKDEIEINVKFDKASIVRGSKRFLRNLNYFYLEHKKLVISVLVILSVFVLYRSYKAIFVLNKNYSQNDIYEASGYTFKINNSYYTDKNYTGNTISDKSAFIILDINVKNNADDRDVNLKRFHIMNGVTNVTEDSNVYSGDFKDLGSVYTGDEIKQGEERNFIMIFRVPKDLKINRYVLFYQELDDRSTLRKIKLKIEDLSEIQDQKELKVNDYMNLELKKEKEELSIDSISIRPRADYTVNNCNMNYCFTEKRVTDYSNGYQVMKIGFSSDTFDSKELIDFCTSYGKIEYIDSSNKTKVDKMTNQLKYSYLGKYVYLKVSDEIANSKSLKLIFTVRNKKYTYVIK